MSRSNYSDDYEYGMLWEQAVERAILGNRGQAFMRRLRDALDALPQKRLIAHVFSNTQGEVCALGAIDPNPGVDPDEPQQVAAHFKIARALAQEIVFQNDECGGWTSRADRETPEERWARMREWVRKQIGPDNEPLAANAVDPQVANNDEPSTCDIRASDGREEP